MYKSSIHKPRKLGQFYLVFKSDIFVNKKNFMKNLNEMCDQVKKQKKNKNNKIYMPNDKEILIAKERSEKGIPVDEVLFKEINGIAKKFRINL